jgi:hypothetical protein
MRTLFVGVALLLALVSCSSKKTIVTSQGTATVETNPLHNTVKITTARGIAIIGKGAVSEKQLGLPLYPGAIGSQTGAEVTRNASGTDVQVTLLTNDSFAQVYAWYKQHMPPGSEETHMVAPGGSVASFAEGKLGDKEQKSVTITETDGARHILLIHTIRHS